MDKVRFVISDFVLTEMLRRPPRGFGQELAREIVARYADGLRRALQGAETYTAVAEALAPFAEIRVHPPIPGDRSPLADYTTLADEWRTRQMAEQALWEAIARHEQG